MPDFITISYWYLFYICPSLMKDNNFMNLKTIILTLTLGALSLCTYNIYGQDHTRTEHNSMDSIQKANKKMQEQQKAKDERTMENAKDASKETKARAKEARRVEQDASDASSESKKALKTEKKAQKARKNADEQAKKAVEAREKSDNN